MRLVACQLDLFSTFERGVSPFFLWIHRALCARLRRPCVGAPRGAGRGEPSEARQTFKNCRRGAGAQKKGPPKAGRAPRRRSGATEPRRRRGASRGDPPTPRPGDGRRRRRRSGASTAPEAGRAQRSDPKARAGASEGAKEQSRRATAERSAAARRTERRAPGATGARRRGGTSGERSGRAARPAAHGGPARKSAAGDAVGGGAGREPPRDQGAARIPLNAPTPL